MSAPEQQTWVSLTKASINVGVAKSTLRKWVHAGKLDHRVVEGPSGPAWEVPLETVQERAAARPRSRAADVGLPVLASELAQTRATFHEMAQALAEASNVAGAQKARAEGLADEVTRLRAVETERNDAEKRAALAEAEAARLRAEAAARIEAEQRAALAEAETARLANELARLSAPAVVEAPEKPRRYWWGGRKAQ